MVTKSLIKDYLKVIKEQNKYCITRKYDFLIVTDDKYLIYSYLRNLKGYKNFTIIESDSLFTNDFYNHSAAKNIGIQYAIDNNYDWLFVYDSDVVIFKDFDFPQNGFAISSWVKLEKNDFNPPIDKTSYTPSSMYLFPRSVFTKIKYNEDYYGHGWEDMEMHYIETYRQGICCTLLNPNCIHLYHDVRVGTYFTEHTAERNERIFREKFMSTFNDEKKLKKILNSE